MPEAHATPRDSTGGQGASSDPSVSSAIEHLLISSQGVITKRIDLALLEGQELLTQTLQRAGLMACGVVLAVAAWFAVAACLALLITPNDNLVLRLAAFALLNAGVAFGLVALARRGWPQTPARANGDATGTTEEPQRQDLVGSRPK